MRNNSNTPPMGNPIAAEAANTYTNLDGNVIEVESLMWLEDGRYWDDDAEEYLDCARYCTNAEEEGADGESVWLNEDYQEVDPDAYPDYDDTEDGEGVEA